MDRVGIDRHAHEELAVGGHVRRRGRIVGDPPGAVVHLQLGADVRADAAERGLGVGGAQAGGVAQPQGDRDAPVVAGHGEHGVARALVDKEVGDVHRVGRAGDGNGEHAGVAEAGACVVGDRVVEAFAQGGAGGQGVDERIGVVDRVGPGAVRSELQGAVLAGEQTADQSFGAQPLRAAGAHRGDLEFRAGAVDIADRVEDVAARIETGQGVVGAARLDGGGGRVGDHRRIVGPLDGDGQRGRILAEAYPVLDRVEEGVGELAAAVAQGLDSGAAVVERVAVAAVAVQGQGAVQAGEVQGGAGHHRGVAGLAGGAGRDDPVGAAGRGVIGQQVAAGIAAGGAVQGPARLDRNGRIRHRVRVGQAGAEHGDGQGRRGR